MRAFWVAAHRYIGLTVGLIIVVIGLTGSVGVFWRPLHSFTDSDYVVKQAGEPWRPLGEMVVALHTAFPSRDEHWYMDFPWYSFDPLYVEYENPVERAQSYERPLYVAINPHTAQVMGHFYWGETLWTWLYNLHSHLHAGASGLQFVGILGVVLLLLALSGLWLWWPVARRFTRHHFSFSRAQMQRLDFSLHRVVGFYFSFVLVALATSGFMIAWPGASERLVNSVAPLSEPYRDIGETGAGIHSVIVPGAKPISADEAVAIAQRLFPTAKLRGLFVPGGPELAYGPVFQQTSETVDDHYPNTVVWVDQYSGGVLEVVDPSGYNASRRFLSLKVPLHNGDVLGAPGHILWGLAGFVPLLMYVTGIRQWLKRRRSGSAVVAT